MPIDNSRSASYDLVDIEPCCINLDDIPHTCHPDSHPADRKRALYFPYLSFARLPINPNAQSRCKSTPAEQGPYCNAETSCFSESNEEKEVLGMLLENDLDSGFESEQDSEGLIPKPEGEAGRPGRGGYNLERALNWDRKQFRKIKLHVKALAAHHLDGGVSYTSQSGEKLSKVVKQLVRKFPVLRKYEEFWPALDLVRSELKYTSSRARQAKAIERLIEDRLERYQADGNMGIEEVDSDSD